MTIESSDVEATLSWTVQRPGTAHGLALWFDSVLVEGITFSNAPSCPELIYGNAFFPLSEPVEIAPRDSMTIKIRANLVGDDYVWCWNTLILEQGKAGRVKADFRQSTLLGAPLSPQRLHKTASSFVPFMRESGQVVLAILELMAAGTALGEIATEIMRRFPGHFRTWQEALTRVGELSVEFAA